MRWRSFRSARSASGRISSRQPAPGRRSGDGAEFTPRFAAVPGTMYVIVGRPDAGEAWRELARVSIPGADLTPRTVVETIDPATEWVPENLLRFSVTFSSAMDEGSAAGHVHVLDETGAVMPGTLLEMPPELWDRRRRRLTVLLEPGRIKRGLQPNVLRRERRSARAARSRSSSMPVSATLREHSSSAARVAPTASGHRFARASTRHSGRCAGRKIR